jgi:crossover junction endodeoxyribonuclease RuvC
LVIGYARAIVWMLAAGLDVGATMYAPASIKKQIAGTGRASKNDVNNAVRGLLRIEQRLEENEADALAVGLTHLTVTGLWNRMFDEG